MCMRGLKEAYNDIEGKIKVYNSEEARKERAKTKLLTGEIDDVVFESELSTQKGLKLHAESPDGVNFIYDLSIVKLSYISGLLIGTDRLIEVCESYKCLVDEIKMHLFFASKDYNIICRFGNLTISHYIFDDGMIYLAGIVNNQLVFMFSLRDGFRNARPIRASSISFNGLDTIVIPVCINNIWVDLNLNVNDYSISR